MTIFNIDDGCADAMCVHPYHNVNDDAPRVGDSTNLLPAAPVLVR